MRHAHPRAKQTLRLSLYSLLGALLLACAAGAPASTGSPAVPSAAIALRTAAPAAQASPAPASAPPASPTLAPAAAPSPAPIAEPQPWRFVVLGDTRTSGLEPPEVTKAIVAQAARAQPAITLTVGDMINALGTPPEVRRQWQFWREAVAPLKPGPSEFEPWLLVTPGNHDVQGHDWATNLLVEAFPELPANGPAGFERRVYSVDYRGVRFISLDSESFDALHLLHDAQLSWLEERLRDNPNPYTIVFSHDPAYPIGPHVGSSLDVYPKARDRFWQLLRQYQVTAYIAGHEHLYNHQQIAGVHQIVAGTSGSAIYSGYGGEFYHYVVGEVGPREIAFTVYDQQGAERDRFVIPHKA